MGGYTEVLRRPRLTSYLAGDFASKIGTGMMVVVLPLLALQVAEPLPPALAVTALLAAPFVLSLPLGLRNGLGRRRPEPRRIMIADSVLRFLMYAVLAVLGFAGALTIWWAMAVLVLGSVLQNVSASSRRILATEMADEDDRLTVNSLLGLSDNFALYVIGPAVGGVLMAAAGAETAMVLSSGAFLALTAVLVTLVAPMAPATGGSEPVRSGLGILLSTSGLVALLVSAFFFNLFYGPLRVAMPLFVQEDLASTEAAFGAVWAALGFGAVIGALITPYLRSFNQARLLVGIVVGWAAVVAAASVSVNVVMLAVLLAVGGLIWAPFLPVVYTLIQGVLSPDDQKPVLTVWNTGYSLASPLGAVLGGLMVTAVGNQGGLLLCGVLTMTLAPLALIALRRMSRSRSGRSIDA